MDIKRLSEWRQACPICKLIARLQTIIGFKAHICSAKASNVAKKATSYYPTVHVVHTH